MGIGEVVGGLGCVVCAGWAGGVGWVRWEVWAVLAGLLGVGVGGGCVVLRRGGLGLVGGWVGVKRVG